jgi:hypothetical protein
MEEERLQLFQDYCYDSSHEESLTWDQSHVTTGLQLTSVGHFDDDMDCLAMIFARIQLK